MSQLKQISMKLNQETLKTVDNLIQLTGEENRTRLVANSLRMMEDILESNKKGKIIFEKENGEREVIKFIGINK